MPLWKLRRGSSCTIYVFKVKITYIEDGRHRLRFGSGLLNLILITKMKTFAKCFSHLAMRQLYSLSAAHFMLQLNWNYIRCIVGGDVHKKYEVKKEINKSKAEKNWDVDKTKAKQPKKKRKKKPGGRRNTIIYVVSEKVFWRSPRPRVSEQFPTFMNEKEITQTSLIRFFPSCHSWPLLPFNESFAFFCRDGRAIRSVAKTTSLTTLGATWWRTRATPAFSLRSSTRVTARHDTSS